MGHQHVAVRRIVALVALAGAALVSAAAPPTAVGQDKTIRVGHQKVGGFAFLKPGGTLEARLKPLGYTVSWKEFAAGPQLLEALRAGAVDLGHGGEAPPIFAQAAGTPFLYIAHEPAAPKAEAILVPKDSPIKTVADLRARKIGLNRGSNVHYLLVRALERAGLKYGDVEVVDLPPADGRVAFEKGAIDAWATWDPYLADAQMSLGARTLVDGTDLVSNHEFLFASRPFAEAHPRVIEVVLDAMRDVYAGVLKDMRGTARTVGAAAGFPVSVVRVMLSRRGFGVEPIGPKVIAEQQKIADTFRELALIPAAINVSDAVRTPRP
jgi:sulfonate transport system substrate-binding protein